MTEWVAKVVIAPGIDIVAVPAVDAVGDISTAPLDPGENNVVAGFDLGDARTNFANEAAALVAEAVWKEPVFAAMAAGFEDLCVADAAICDFDEDLTRLECGHIEISHLERAVEFDEHRGCRLHAAILRSGGN